MLINTQLQHHIIPQSSGVAKAGFSVKTFFNFILFYLYVCYTALHEYTNYTLLSLPPQKK